MKRRNLLILSAIILVLFLFISGCAATGRISSFFESGEFKQHAKIIDFALFFVIFFSLTYIGLSRVWGEGFGKPGAAKGPIVGLSMALALALAFALISQTSFSITTIFPLAKAFFFIVIWFLLWGLLVMSKVFGDHWGGKLVAAILAGIMAYLLFSIATHMICQMSDNMDDPACQSDFFNAAFNLGGRLFGVNSWAWSGGGGYWASSGWGYASTVPPPSIPSYSYARQEKIAQQQIKKGEAVPEEIKKEPKETCRMDITFVVGQTTPLVPGPSALQAKLEDYVKSVKAMEGKKTIKVYGFASVEGEKAFNWGLSGRRADAIKSIIRKIDSSVSVSAYAEGEVSIFSTTDLEPNRRVVLSTEPLTRANLAAAISPGSAEGCPPPKEAGEEGVKGKEAGGTGLSWWWLLLLLLLIPLFMLLRRKKGGLNIIEAIKKKSLFQKELKEIEKEKDKIRELISNTETANKDQDTQRQTARALLESIKSDLRKRKTIQQIAKDYKGRENEIAKESVLFGVDEQHARQLQRIIIKMKDRGFDHSAPDFNDNLLNTVAEMISGHTLLKELHDFLRLQVRLKNSTKEFMKLENDIIKYAEKRDRRKAMLETTTRALDFCEKVVEKAEEIISIEEVLMEKYSEEENDRMWQMYVEEKGLIKKLTEAIELQKKQLSKLSVVIIKPEANRRFKPDERLKVIAGVVNGRPPFRCVLFWGNDISKVPLTEELHFSKHKIEVELPDSFINLAVQGKKDPLLQERFWVSKEMKDHYRLSIMLYDSTKAPSHYDYKVTGPIIPDCAQDDTIMIISAEQPPGAEAKTEAHKKAEAALNKIESVLKEAEQENKEDEQKEEQAREDDLEKLDKAIEEAEKEGTDVTPEPSPEAESQKPEEDIDIPIDVDEKAVRELEQENRAEEVKEEEIPAPAEAAGQADKPQPPGPSPPRKSHVSDVLKEEIGKKAPFLRVQGDFVYVVVDSETRDTVKLEEGDRIGIPFFRRTKISMGRHADSALIVTQKSEADIHAFLSIEKRFLGKKKYFMNVEKGAPPTIIIKKGVGVVVPFADDEDKERLRKELAEDKYGFLKEYLTAYNREKGLFAEKKTEIDFGDIIFLGPEYRFTFARY